MDRIRRLDVEAIAGIVAAVIALVLHLLHVADEALLLAIMLVILALILVRDLRREAREDRQTEALEGTVTTLSDIHAAVTPPDTVLVGPSRLREASALFSQQARGEMVWFNVCLSMFESQALFDALLRPAIENPRVTSIQFVLDEGERARWQDAVAPKVAGCAGAERVLEPRVGSLEESVSIILAETDAGGFEALLSFYGEPFMARASGQEVPRYIFHVQRNSELIGRLRELERGYRLGT
jgi:hypothetical protein